MIAVFFPVATQKEAVAHFTALVSPYIQGHTNLPDDDGVCELLFKGRSVPPQFDHEDTLLLEWRWVLTLEDAA